METEQNNQENQNLPDPPQSPPPPPTPPIQNQGDGATNNTRVLAALEETLREQNREIQRLREENSKVTRESREVSREPVRTAEEARTDFFNSPHAETEKIINKALQDSVVPLIRDLQKFASGIQSDTLVSRLVGNVKRHAALGVQVTSDVEPILNDMLSKLPPEQLNDQTAIGTLVHILGLKAAGILPNSTPVNNNPQPNPPTPVNNNPNPAHLRPSPPPQPNTDNAKKAINLSEAERRLARERNMTAEEYVYWRDLPADQVATSRYGMEAPK